MEALLAWQPPRTNGRSGEREGGGEERRTLRDKESRAMHMHMCMCWWGSEGRGDMLNYNVMCMHWNSMLMIYTHSSYFYSVTIYPRKLVFSVHVWMMTSYRTAGNFQGRKLSRISRKGAFRGENFRGWLKNREIRESFLPRKFPAIRY